MMFLFNIMGKKLGKITDDSIDFSGLVRDKVGKDYAPKRRDSEGEIGL